MRAPIRVAYATRMSAPFALVAAASAVSALFAATPFLIPEIASRYGVSEGTAASISVAQVGAFAAATFVVPRLIAPSAALLRSAAVALVCLNLISAALPDVFWILVALRAAAGTAAGALTWITWTDAMRSKSSLTEIAAVGPVTALVVAPIVALLAGPGDRAIYAFLGAIAVPAAIATCEVSGERRRRGTVSRSRSNPLLLGALFLVTLTGSSLAVNLVIVGREVHGLSPLATSAGFSLDAMASLIGARLSTRHRHPGAWLALAGLGAMSTVLGPAPLGFFIGIIVWGFGFWMAVPGVFGLLSDRSLEPGERAGDAQGLMAVGRALGPAMGGAFVNAGALTALAYVAGGGIIGAASTVGAVAAGRTRLPPSDPRTVPER